MIITQSYGIIWMLERIIFFLNNTNVFFVRFYSDSHEIVTPNSCFTLAWAHLISSIKIKTQAFSNLTFMKNSIKPSKIFILLHDENHMFSVAVFSILSFLQFIQLKGRSIINRGKKHNDTNSQYMVEWMSEWRQVYQWSFEVFEAEKSMW